jgi:hypothetical protein
MGTKQDLLVDIMRQGNQRLIRTARLALEGVELPEQRLAILVQVHVLVHAVFQLDTRVVDGEVRALTPETRPQVIAVRDEYEGIWRETLEQGYQKGVFGTLDPGLARLALLGMCTAVNNWYSPGGRLSLFELGRHFAAMALALVQASREGKPISLDDVELKSPEWFRALPDWPGDDGAIAGEAVSTTHGGLAEPAAGS